jgi:hypothetical protein
MTDQESRSENNRIFYAFIIGAVGITVSGIITLVLAALGWKSSSDIVAVVGLFTSFTGTLVGVFFGIQVGSSGKEMDRNINERRHNSDQEEKREIQHIAYKALALLDPTQASKIFEDLKSQSESTTSIPHESGSTPKETPDVETMSTEGKTGKQKPKEGTEEESEGMAGLGALFG